MKYSLLPALLIVTVLVASLFQQNAMSEEDKKPAKTPEVPEGFEYIDLGGGCFWCIETILQRVEGIESVTSGYMGGATKNPTYEQVLTGRSGHAEIVRVIFDPKKITTEHLLEWFWKLHDPTTLNRQGNDVGTQYRSAIFYNSDEQKKVAEASKEKNNSKFDNKIVTEITKASQFYPAEVYHQDYFKLKGKDSRYCQFIIPPKLKKLGLEDKEEK